MNSLENYLQNLKSKGFHFGEDVIGFIYFGKQYTGASDELTNVAIEYTLKAQRKFDGSFYISLLETFSNNGICNREEAVRYVNNQKLLGT
ncbi:DUF6123 family protein [Bacillus sp. B15-48]|uniref:DUF6123 family protein n=1 Tax=Bacillus sp. B15-48 TaxID=1548601 RepID=UPI00193FC137|nr:DUF6123 family protein [Bacillus sp. B15-48]MBM4762061.1 hypothetical protein [Bacillus sp. B15-48]